jgi:hypothetical protein
MSWSEGPMPGAKGHMPEASARMTCGEFDALLDSGDPLSRSQAARLHAQSCPRCQALARTFSGFASDTLPPSALAKAEAAAVRQLAPVRALSSPLIAAIGALAALVCLIGLSVWVYGSHGWVARLPLQRAASYLGAGSVLVLSLAAALREREPGLSLAAPWRYAAAMLATLVWAGPFVVYEFRPEPQFWKHGTLCGSNGLLVGVAAGAVIWLVMRRGYLLSPLRAGWFAGISAGCLAFIVQETYCPVVESAHSALWHGGVVAVLGAVGSVMASRAFRRD